MIDEKWKETIGTIKDQFTVFEHKREQLEESPGELEYIVFASPLGKVKLERRKRPLVLNKKALGSKRIGGRTQVVLQYSDTEFVDTLKAYKFEESIQDWQEIEGKNLFPSSP